MTPSITSAANTVPRVTVVMAACNAAQFVRKAVASVLAQTYRDFELIVVDDSSSDDSLSILQSFDDPRILIIRHQTNRGAALSRNDALAAGRGELIAIMDADDVCVPTRLERQVAFLDANPRVGLVGCGVYDNIDAEGAVLHTSYLPEHNEAIQRNLMERWCFFHSSIMFRRTLYETVGGYVRALEPAEDHDFVLRILEHCEAHNLYERLVSYRLNPKGLSVMSREYIEQVRAASIRLAQRRRAGRSEDREGEISRIRELKRMRKPQHGLVSLMQTVRDSFCAANRYYGFGCLELCAGHLKTARRCFVHSVRSNGLFVKSWIGIGLSLMPFVADRVKVVFRSSMQHHNGVKLAGSPVAGTRAVVERTLIS
ncbi:MAG TPA: glycosyltransferase [Candidatus Aquilonibacter sp.]|nr:glycosyltransferase [Candidatus Aquilonibacter sp.]